jgi:hypothetical protein
VPRSWVAFLTVFEWPQPVCPDLPSNAADIVLERSTLPIHELGPERGGALPKHRHDGRLTMEWPLGYRFALLVERLEL